MTLFTSNVRFCYYVRMDELTPKEAEAYGYKPAKLLADGRCAGILNMIYTVGLFVGMDEIGPRSRYCYHTRHEAEEALALWDGTGDPPGNWIKQKPEERMNPNYKEVAEI